MAGPSQSKARTGRSREHDARPTMASRDGRPSWKSKGGRKPSRGGRWAHDAQGSRGDGRAREMGQEPSREPALGEERARATRQGGAEGVGAGERARQGERKERRARLEKSGGAADKARRRDISPFFNFPFLTENHRYF
jgi:hypothetical protein